MEKIAIVLVVLFGSIVSGDEIVVDPDGGEDPLTIQAGINAALAGDVVIVMPGTYFENITLKNGVSVVGAGADVTVLDGGGVGSVVMAVGCDPNTLLEGFTIRNGGGIELSEPGVTFGGGMITQYSFLRISECVFENNSAIADGGGMYNFMYGSPVVVDCVFRDNEAGLFGGAIASYGYCNPGFVNCVFSGNSAQFGGGMSNIMFCPAVTINCTFAFNTATETGGAIYNMGSNAEITNCILWGDDPNEIFNYESVPSVSFSSIGVDPFFVGDGDYRLQSDSPCIDAGDNEAISPELAEFTGREFRYTDGDCNGVETVDIGAYEFEHKHVGDVNADCSVGLGDVAMLAVYWLSDEEAVDIDSDGDVDIADIAVVSANWLSGVE